MFSRFSNTSSIISPPPPSESSIPAKISGVSSIMALVIAKLSSRFFCANRTLAFEHNSRICFTSFLALPYSIFPYLSAAPLVILFIISRYFSGPSPCCFSINDVRNALFKSRFFDNCCFINTRSSSFVTFSRRASISLAGFFASVTPVIEFLSVDKGSDNIISTVFSLAKSWEMANNTATTCLQTGPSS